MTISSLLMACTTPDLFSCFCRSRSVDGVDVRSFLFSDGVWPICIKQHGRISKITILLKRHFSLCTRMLCSSYQSKINTVNTKTRITRITMIWNVYKLTIMTSPPFKGKFIKHAMWTNFNSGICLQSPMVNPCVLKSGESMVNFSIEHHLKFSLN